VAIGTTATGSHIYAADFHNAQITVLNSAGSISGSFVDPTIPAGFAPFNIQAETIGGNTVLFVTYAKQDAAKKDDSAGAGNGYVDEFDLNGNFIKRVASTGVLNSPWGVTVAPAGFGSFGGDLLVGNFGDGKINAFDPTTNAFLGALTDANGQAIVNDGLWDITFGNNGPGFSPNSLYLTAGLNDEADGLFARIDAVPEPGTFALLAAGLFGAACLRRRRTAK
jgi:uncharacterized protein (TIGR03118 family)